MRSFGPRSLLQLPDGRTVLRRQLDLVGAALPGAQVVVVVGEEAERVVRATPAGVRVVENEGFAESGPVRSGLLGVRAAGTGRVLLVHGDVVFDQAYLGAMAGAGSAVLLGRERAGDRVGATVDGGRVVHLGYDVGVEWRQAVLLGGDELRLFRAAAAAPDARKKHLFELLNDVTEAGGVFAAAYHAGTFAEIDSPADFRAVCRGLK